MTTRTKARGVMILNCCAVSGIMIVRPSTMVIRNTQTHHDGCVIQIGTILSLSLQELKESKSDERCANQRDQLPCWDGEIFNRRGCLFRRVTTLGPARFRRGGEMAYSLTARKDARVTGRPPRALNGPLPRTAPNIPTVVVCRNSVSPCWCFISLILQITEVLKVR